MATVHVKVTADDNFDSTDSDSEGENGGREESTHTAGSELATTNGAAEERTQNADSISEEDGADKAGEELLSSDFGLADVISKILKKPVPKHKTTILASGQTDREIQKRKRAKEKENGTAEKKSKQDRKKSKQEDDSSGWSDLSDEEDNKARRLALQRQKEWEEMARVKPGLLDKDRERNFQKIATRGVVQLFNAVKQQQSMMGDKSSNPRLDRRKKALGATKKNFLDLLDSKAKKEKPKQEDASEKSGTWSILREDFMMGAKMKDWDRDGDSDGGGDDNMADGSEMSDSD